MMRVMGPRHQAGDVEKRLPRFRFHADLSLGSLQFTQSTLAMASGLPMLVTTSYDIHVTV